MLNAINLKVEYKRNPLGMDEQLPRFSYELKGNAKAQSAYRIVVSKSADGTIVWDSGFVAGRQSSQIIYEGEPLERFTRYDWKVQVKDEKGKSGAFSQGKDFFETGFLGSPWTGKWISGRGGSGNQMPPQRLLRRFEITKKVASARLYTTALGLYEAYLNGKKVTEDVFTPGWTDYYKRVQYQAYDVTGLLQPGLNMLADLLGDGWFCGCIARLWDSGSPTYGKHAALCQELHITYEDGTTEIIASDENYKRFFGVASIKMSDIYQGETYDATEDDLSWKLPTKDTADEFPAVTPSADYFLSNKKFPEIVWQSGAPVRRMLVRKPVTITKRPNGSYIVDFGQNLVGRERFTLRNSKQGTAILIRHGEMLNQDGSLYVANLRSAAATTLYYAGNARKASYEPTFTYYGFRYLEITGWPGELTKNDLEVEVIYSALETTGSFECSNPLINQLYSNIVWGQRSNFLDVPTDCPQRDERMGWTGDTQVFSNIATYNMASGEFYTKWIYDLNSCQLDGGGYTQVAPYMILANDRFFKGFATGWADAGIICPLVMLRKYGDKRLSEKYLANMLRYLEIQVRAAGNSYLVNNACYGDWLNLDDDTDRSLLSTAYLAGMAKEMTKLAAYLGRNEIAIRSRAIANGATKAFQNAFIKDKQLTVKSQTAALLTLHFDLYTPEAYQNICDALVESIQVTHKLHLSTGFLGTPLLLKVLTKIGKIDLAYALLEQTTYPGWLYPVTQGATSMWERWNSWNEKTGFGDIHMNSFNHYAYGAVGEWFFETICGIDPDATGSPDFRLAPQFGKSLKYAKAEFHSQYGLIASAWQRKKDAVLWDFTIPCNTTAEIVLPGQEEALKAAGIPQAEDGSFHAPAGSYQVTVK